MPTGDCERAVAAAAAADGIALALVGRSLPWLTQRGHFDLDEGLVETRRHLASIFEALSGDAPVQAAKRSAPLPGDLIHLASKTLVEVDEHQHFTSFRRMSLELYPNDVPLGFDVARYLALCDEWAPKADRYRAAKAAPGFGEGGRQRQRAYNDSLRDLASVAMGFTIVRIDAPDRDGASAYRRNRDRLLAAIG